MKKRMIGCLLVVAMILVLIPVYAASDGATFTVTPPEELPKAGDEFEVVVSLENNPGFNALQFTLVFDKTLMECTKIKTGTVLKEMLSATNPNAENGVIVASATLDTVAENGIVVICTCKALTDIESWQFAMEQITFEDAQSNALTYDVVGATVTEPEPEEDIRPGGALADDMLDEPDDEPMEEPTEPGIGGTVTEPEESDETEPEVPLTTFPDTNGHWAEKEIGLAADKGLFKGDDLGNFNPDADVTRAQFVTVLWRMAGSPAVETKAPFADIENQISEFQSAIAWGFANGYINGISETEFDPEGTLTREAGMKILHFYSGGAKGNEQMLTLIYDDFFDDSKEISSWAKDSVYWGIYNTLISGTSKTTLSPQGTATRAQLAKILVNYIKNFK
ncbi:MAG: S-layer homology domain-containing protein [Clostridia bacterium]|nr:S-layer homology domain-containing protein [Clostridia bacterium]